MKEQVKYWIGALLFLPLLPILAIQGKRLLKRFPRLPAAKDPQGVVPVIGDDLEKYRVLVIGESTMAGLGVKAHKDGFAGKFAEYLSAANGKQVHWQVVAQSGITAGRFRQLFMEKLPETAPDLMLIGLGANDVFELNSPGRWRRDMEDLMIALATIYPVTKLILIHLPPVEVFPGLTSLMRFVFGNLINLYHFENQKLGATFEYLEYVNKRIIFKEWISLIPEAKKVSDFFSDGVHPNQITYDAWAKEIVKFVLSEKNTAG